MSGSDQRHYLTNNLKALDGLNAGSIEKPEPAWRNRLAYATRSALVAAAVLASTSAAVSQAQAVPDAQVEANVLKALAGAPELASEAITTRTVYGTVTLSGTVSSETLRTRAENLAANAPGVKKVVDELALGNAADLNGQAGAGGPAPGMVLQSDGTYAPAQPAGNQDATSSPQQSVRNNPEADQELDRQMDAQQNGAPQPAANGSQPTYPQQPNGQYPPQDYPQGGYPQQGNPQSGYPPQGYPQGSTSQQGYPQQSYPQQSYPQQGFPQRGYPQQGPQPGYATHGYAAPVDGGQVAGQVVTVPAGSLIRLRINQRISSDHSRPGDSFDGIVINDVVAGGAIAIPRGAQVRGTVVDSKASGVLKGRGELTLQLNQILLAGKSYPIVSDSWAHNGGDKTIETINKTAGLGAFGALVGAVAGGGPGAAIGAGVGAAAGLGSSAASGRGQVVIPSEAVLTFHLADPVTLTTVSEQEMQRLAYGVPAGGPPAMQRRYPRPYYYPAAPPPPYGYPY